MGGRGGSSGMGGGGTKYLSGDKALYESKDEVLRVRRVTNERFGTDIVLGAGSLGEGHIGLDYADPVGYVQHNSKTNMAIYELKTGLAYASEYGPAEVRYASDTLGMKDMSSSIKSGNSYRGINSVGIDWDKVHEVSGRTYEVKDFLKNKGFKWNGTRKSWTK